MARDNFPKPVIENLRKRVQDCCSHPDCGCPTSGPHSGGHGAVSIGEAAHITAASRGGARYDGNLTQEFRRSAANGIWLCRTHARLIDADDPRYPVELLYEWKQRAEEIALAALGKPPGSGRATLPHHVLEARPQSFSGRGDLIARMKDVLRQPGSRFLLYGEPGNGKSLTALECAWQLCDQFSAVVYLSCGLGRDAEAVGLALASKLPGHNPTEPSERQIAVARQWLGDRRTLLVFDDVWSDDLTALLPDRPISLLVTSRQSQRFNIAPEFRLDIQGFNETEAEEFFAARLPGYWPTQRGPLVALWRRFEGSPYALAVSASLLEKPSARPFADVLMSLASPEKLKDGRLDVTRLLKQAVERCGADAQALVTALAFCSPQSVWLEFAARVASLTADAAQDAASELAQAALLRIPDRENGLVAIHTLLREVLREVAEAKAVWPGRHAIQVSRQFAAWWSDKEGEWRNCHRMIAEGPLALDRLEAQPGPQSFYSLAYQIFDLGKSTGLLNDAYRAIRRYQKRAEELGDRSGLQASLGNQALILQAWGQLDDAMALHKEQERICRELGDKSGLQASLGNQALILQAREQLDDAMALLKEQERICRELGDKSGLQASLGNQAVILQAWGQLDDAMALFKEQERICRDLGDKSGLQASLGNQALILKARGHLDDAMALHKEQERICRELGDKSGLGQSLGNQALILKAWGQLDDAMALHKEKERICRELGDRAGLARSLANQSNIHRDRQPPDLDSARALITEALQIFTELGMPGERDRAQRQLDSLN